MQTNSFIRLRKFSTVRGPVVEIQDMGDSEAIISNKTHLRETAREMIRRGVSPPDGGWNGWLGRYQKALVDAAFALEQEKAKERERRRSLLQLGGIRVGSPMLAELCRRYSFKELSDSSIAAEFD